MPCQDMPHLRQDHLGRLRPTRQPGAGLRPRRPVVPRPPTSGPGSRLAQSPPQAVSGDQRRLVERADPGRATAARLGPCDPSTRLLGTATRGASSRLGAASSVAIGGVGYRPKAPSPNRGCFIVHWTSSVRDTHSTEGDDHAGAVPQRSSPTVRRAVHRARISAGPALPDTDWQGRPPGALRLDEHITQGRAPMIESLKIFPAAAPGGRVSVGAGWPSPTAWAVAGLAIAVLALIARWATGRRRRRVDAHVPTTGAEALRHRPAPTQRGLTQTERPERERP